MTIEFSFPRGREKILREVQINKTNSRNLLPLAFFLSFDSLIIFSLFKWSIDSIPKILKHLSILMILGVPFGIATKFGSTVTKSQKCKEDYIED